MSERMQNIGALFKNSRTRVIIIFTLVILFGAIAFGFMSLNKQVSVDNASANVGRIPGRIESIP